MDSYVTYTRDGSTQVLTPNQAEDLEDILARGHRCSSVRYGWRTVLGRKGVQRPSRHEQIVLAKIRELRALGWGRVRIARYLNATPWRPRGRRGNTRWHIETVRRLLERIDAENKALGTSSAT